MNQAIVVGVGRYPKFGADGVSPNDLPGAVDDARDMADWLINSAGAQVTLITSDGTGSNSWTVTSMRPTMDDVNNAFVPFVTSKASRVAQRLYVYVAGHGLAPEPRSRSLILADAVGIEWVPNLDVPSWIDWFSKQTHFDELVLWMDCCATQATEYTPTRPSVPNFATRTPPPAKVFMAFGSGAGRAAYEAPIGPKGEVRGLFTQQLLRGLKGAAADGNGEVTSASLANYLVNSATEGTMQQAVVPQRDDMIFAINAPPTYRIKALTGNGSLLPDGTPVTLTSPPSPMSQSAQVVGGWASFSLGVGLYKLTGPNLTRLVEIAASTPSDIE